MLSSIIQSAMDGIITVDESQRIVLFNRAAESMFGVPAAEAIGTSLDRFIPERFRRAHSGHIRAFGRTGVTMRAMGRLGTLSGLRADGTEFSIEASISQAVSGGRRFYTVVLRNISDRKRLEEQLMQSQKMEGIGRLAGGIAHDFNNYLMAIFNYLTLARRRVGADHPAQADLDNARAAGERAAMLIRQLLDFARKQAVTQRVLDPGEVVKGVEPLLGRLVGDGVTLRIVLARDTWSVRADAGQLSQVLLNLAVNARDAMPGGGTLTIESANVTLDGEYCLGHTGAASGDHVVLSVTDSGMGIAPEHRARLFEPFFTTKPAGQGTGLGLAICHGVVRQSGGHIAVESEPGRGTTFRILLPRAVEEPETDHLAVPRPATGGETVLVVEESPMVRALAADSLRAAGYLVLAASTPADALRVATEHPGRIHLLLSNAAMPGMSGKNLAAALERARGLSRSVFVTEAQGEPSGNQRSGNVVAGFISKPFTPESLVQKVREILDA